MSKSVVFNNFVVVKQMIAILADRIGQAHVEALTASSAITAGQSNNAFNHVQTLEGLLGEISAMHHVVRTLYRTGRGQ